MRYSVIVLGATGNVGRRIVELLIRTSDCARVIAVTRRQTGAFSEPKVAEVVVDMSRMEADLAPHVQGVDIALAAFGVGKGSAKMSEDEVRRIEVAYPAAFCRAAKAGGARVGGVMTAAGANPKGSSRYLRIIGEKEEAAKETGFDVLGLYRPGVILGNSNTPGVLNALMPLVDWALPSRFHSIHKNDLARAMVAQSAQALMSLAEAGGRREPVVRVLEHAGMAPFFVAGDRNED